MSQSLFFSAFPEEFEECICHTFCSAGNIENLAHHNAESDDDSNASQRSAKTTCDGIDDTDACPGITCGIHNVCWRQRHTSDDANHNRADNQGKESLYLCFQYKHNQQSYANH